MIMYMYITILDELLFLIADICGVFLKAVNDVALDKKFQINQGQFARKIIEWAATTPPEPLILFAYRIFLSLINCFSSKPLKSLQKEREVAWTQFHVLRCSSEFHKAWCSFIKRDLGITGINPSPLLYQQITLLIFKHVTTLHNQVKPQLQLKN